MNCRGIAEIEARYEIPYEIKAGKINMALFIDGPEAKIIRTGDTTVELRIFAGEVYTGLEPHRLFPLSGITRYISLLDSEQKEKAIIRDIEKLDPESRSALEGCLDEYYMIPKITGVYSVSTKYGIVTWNCRTDHGDRTFIIKSHNDVKILYDGRVLVRDSNDNRYEIENVNALDRHSRKALANQL